MSFTNYLEERILNEVFGATAFAAPASLYVGLSTTAINDDGTGATEPAGGSYARASVANNTTNWPAWTSASGKRNGAAISFPTASASWGTITWFFISDAASGGNMLAKAALTTSKTIDSGDTASFAVNDLQILLD